jgi:hypothetical protein
LPQRNGGLPCSTAAERRSGQRQKEGKTRSIFFAWEFVYVVNQLSAFEAGLFY